HVHRIHRQARSEHPFSRGIPRKTDPRLEIVVVSRVQATRGMDQTTLQTSDRISHVRIEVAQQVVLSAERAFIAVPQSQIQSEVGRKLPVILKIEAVNIGSWLPRSQFFSKLCLTNITQ